MPAVTHDDTSQEQRFNALYTEYRTGIRRRIEYVLKDMNKELWDDSEQEAWLRIWRALPGAPEASFMWCSTIASHVAIDAIRRKYHYNTYSRTAHLPPAYLDSPEAESIFTWEDAAPDLETQAIARETIREMLALVTDGQRAVCLAFMRDGYSYKEIMAHFGYSFAKVDYSINVLRERARKTIEIS